MSDTWNRYCEKLEELRRLQDEARKRRKPSTAGVEIIDKAGSISGEISAPDKLPATAVVKTD